MSSGIKHPDIDNLIISGKYTSSEIAKITGYNQKSVNTRARNIKIKLPLPPKLKVNHDFFKLRTPEMAYFLGFIAADGCINHMSHADSWRLSIQLHKKDVEVLKSIKKYMKSEHKIYKYKNMGYYNYVGFQVTSKIICDDLINLGITERKSLTLKWIDLSENIKNHFIRGFFDGDGCITIKHNSPKISFVGTKDFLDGLKECLPHKDGTMYQKKDITNFWELSYYGKRAMNICEYMYKDSNESIRLSRKYNKFLIQKEYYKSKLLKT